MCGLFGRILDKAFGPREMIKNDKKKPDGYGLGEDTNTDDWKTG